MWFAIRISLDQQNKIWSIENIRAQQLHVILMFLNVARLQYLRPIIVMWNEFSIIPFPIQAHNVKPRIFLNNCQYHQYFDLNVNKTSEIGFNSIEYLFVSLQQCAMKICANELWISWHSIHEVQFFFKNEIFLAYREKICFKMFNHSVQMKVEILLSVLP